MMRSLYSGVSGLRVHQTKMDVIGNNISNINTVGFKKSNVTFSDVFSQTLSGATAANDAVGKGGINGMQVGLGSTVAAISNIMTVGSSQRTDNGNDIMIDGDGFFVVSDATGYYFTRAGAFEVDESGNLTDTNGMKVCGWEAIEDKENPGKQKIVQSKAEGINLYSGDKSYSPPEQTTRIEFEGNLNVDTGPERKGTMSIYDSIGNRYTIDTLLKYDEANKNWKFSMGNSAIVNGDTSESSRIALNLADGQEWTITFKEDGTVDTAATQPLPLASLAFSDPATAYKSEFAPEIVLDFSNLTQFNAIATATAVSKDGYAAGSLSGFSVGQDGVITGSYTNGTSKMLGQIVVATFKNPAGLEKSGSNLYKATVNSGEFDGIGMEIASNGGKFIGGALEMSNVDLASEFTEMITTQRGFQANSKVITTSDDMLQELLGLKR